MSECNDGGLSDWAKNRIQIGELVDYWQDSGDMHPLTCGNNSGHAVLRWIPDWGVLVCPHCSYTQNDIPPHVIDYGLARKAGMPTVAEQLRENIQRKNDMEVEG